jgi:tetratricopeptide (TPR) repeat protein
VLELSAGIEKDSAVARIVPPGIKQVVRARLERLAVPTKTLLLAASVLGQSFSFDDARRIADLSENDALTAIDELLQGLLIREAAERGASAYLFAHDKIRDVVYREATDARRRVFHRRAAEVLEVRAAPPAEIVRHALAAGLEETALAASMKAGDSAARILAPGDAILHFTRAIELAATLGKDDVALEAQIRRAKSRASIAQWVDARNDLESALEKLAPAARELRAELLVALSEARFWSLDVPRLHESGAAAVALAREVGREDLERAALGWVGGAAGADGKLDAALESYEHAVGSAARLGVPPPAHVLTLHSLTLYWVGRIDEAFERSRAAVAIAKTTNDVSVTLYALSQLGLALGAAGRYPEAWDAFDEARRYGREFGMDTLMARSIAMAGGTRLETFDFAHAEELALEAREISRAAAWPPAGASASIDLLFNFVRRGDAGKAEELVPSIAESVEKAAGFHGWLWRLRLMQVRAEIALARRDWETAAARATDVVSRSEENNRTKYRVLGLATRGRALVERGNRKEALADLNTALVLARTIADPSLFLRVAAALLPTFGDDALLAETRATAERLVRVLPDGRSRLAFERGVHDHLGLRVS